MLTIQTKLFLSLEKFFFLVFVSCTPMTPLTRTTSCNPELNVFFFNFPPLFTHILLLFNDIKRVSNKRNNLSFDIKNSQPFQKIDRI